MALETWVLGPAGGLPGDCNPGSKEIARHQQLASSGVHSMGHQDTRSCAMLVSDVSTGTGQSVQLIISAKRDQMHESRVEFIVGNAGRGL